jgi:hypothetical protein
MVKYLFPLYGTSETLPEPGTEEFARMRADWDAATGAMARAGVLIDCAPLQPPAAATTVRVRDGETLLTDGPAAGLVILDTVGGDARLARWPQLHIARAELLRRLGRRAEAVAAYEAAVALEPPAPERAYLARRMREW